MAALAQPATATDKTLYLDADVSTLVPGQYLRIGAELIQFVNWWSQVIVHGWNDPPQPDYSKLIVKRGQMATTAAAHDIGAEVETVSVVMWDD